MSFFAGDVMIECTEVSREAGQGICALCLEYAGLVTCNQHRPRVMPWRTRWSQSNTPESIGVLRIQCKYPSVQHMVPHSDMQSSSWILLKRDVRLKKRFFFFFTREELHQRTWLVAQLLAAKVPAKHEELKTEQAWAHDTQRLQPPHRY